MMFCSRPGRSDVISSLAAWIKQNLPDMWAEINPEKYPLDYFTTRAFLGDMDSQFFLEEMFSRLDEIAPEGFVFDSNPNGGGIGFFPLAEVDAGDFDPESEPEPEA